MPFALLVLDSRKDMNFNVVSNPSGTVRRFKNNWSNTWKKEPLVMNSTPKWDGKHCEDPFGINGVVQKSSAVLEPYTSDTMSTCSIEHLWHAQWVCLGMEEACCKDHRVEHVVLNSTSTYHMFFEIQNEWSMLWRGWDCQGPGKGLYIEALEHAKVTCWHWWTYLGWFDRKTVPPRQICGWAVILR